MSKLSDLTGKRFGNLLVLDREKNFISKNGDKVTAWNCLCDCGNKVCVRAASLKQGMTKSCGCMPKMGNYKHGLSKTRIHGIWSGMKDRCYNTQNNEYHNYGQRGIRVCNDWLGKDGFINFYNWAMSSGYRDNLSIDRLNVNGNYFPENCKWSTITEQANNKRNSLIIEYEGQNISLSQLCKMYKVNYHTAYGRYKKGLSLQEILFNEPWSSHISGGRKKTAQIDIKTLEILKVYESATSEAKENGISSPDCIMRCCTGKRKTCHGFIWKYI